MSEQNNNTRLVDMTLGDLLRILSAREERLKNVIVDTVSGTRQDDNSSDKLMSVTDVAEYTGYSEGTIRHLVFNREIPHLKRWKFVRFDRQKVREWLTSNPVASKAELNSIESTPVTLHKTK